MNLEELMTEWEGDAEVSPFDLSGEAIRIGKLKAKYMRHFSNFNLKAKKLGVEFREKKDWKRRYYKGEFNNPKDLEQYKIEPYRGLAVNADIQAILDADSELNKILLAKDYNEECARFCELVLDELTKRSFSIGNAIKWNIFQGGG